MAFEIAESPETPEDIKARFSQKHEMKHLARILLRNPSDLNVWYFKNVLLALGEDEAPRMTKTECLKRANEIVINTPMQLVVKESNIRCITTRYIGPTNTKGARVKAVLVGTAIQEIYSWDYDSETPHGGHVQAALALMRHVETRAGFESWCCHDWEIESCYIGDKNIHFIHTIRRLK